MSITSGYTKYKRYAKLSDGTYKLVSQWTSSNTVHFDDGNTAQTKVGAINGITDSLTATSSNVALSAKGGNNLQGQIDTLNSNFSELGTGKFYGWCILRVQGGVGYLYITDTNIKSTDTIAFNENLEIVGVVYKQLSSIVVKNRNGGFLVTITFDGMDNYNNYLVGFDYTVSR